MKATEEAVRRLKWHLNDGGLVVSNGRAWNAKKSDNADLVAMPRWSLIKIIDLLEGREPSDVGAKP